MHRWNRRIGTLVVFLLLGVVPASAQTTLGFEDVAGGFLTSYGGFLFSGGQGGNSWVIDDNRRYDSDGDGVVDADDPDDDGDGILDVDDTPIRLADAGRIGNVALWSNGGAWLEFSGGVFDFNSVYLAAMNGPCRNGASGVTQTARGFRNGVEIASATASVACGSGAVAVFDLFDVDRVVFDAPLEGPVNLVVDELTYNGPPATEVVPEPITMVLLGSGLAGVGAVRRRRRKDDAQIG